MTYKLDLFTILYANELPAYIYACAIHACLMPTWPKEGRRSTLTLVTGVLKQDVYPGSQA